MAGSITGGGADAGQGYAGTIASDFGLQAKVELPTPQRALGVVEPRTVDMPDVGPRADENYLSLEANLLHMGVHHVGSEEYVDETHHMAAMQAIVTLDSAFDKSTKATNAEVDFAFDEGFASILGSVVSSDREYRAATTEMIVRLLTDPNRSKGLKSVGQKRLAQETQLLMSVGVCQAVAGGNASELVDYVQNVKEKIALDQQVTIVRAEPEKANAQKRVLDFANNPLVVGKMLEVVLAACPDMESQIKALGEVLSRVGQYSEGTGYDEPKVAVSRSNGAVENLAISEYCLERLNRLGRVQRQRIEQAATIESEKGKPTPGERVAQIVAVEALLDGYPVGEDAQGKRTIVLPHGVIEAEGKNIAHQLCRPEFANPFDVLPGYAAATPERRADIVSQLTANGGEMLRQQMALLKDKPNAELPISIVFAMLAEPLAVRDLFHSNQSTLEKYRARLNNVATFVFIMRRNQPALYNDFCRATGIPVRYESGKDWDPQDPNTILDNVFGGPYGLVDPSLNRQYASELDELNAAVNAGPLSGGVATIDIERRTREQLAAARQVD